VPEAHHQDDVRMTWIGEGRGGGKGGGGI
jgi:hypothetical protein